MTRAAKPASKWESTPAALRHRVQPGWRFPRDLIETIRERAAKEGRSASVVAEGLIRSALSSTRTST